ncbi:MAG: hypothetical protein Q8K82_11235 [Gemmatimonadaceae bacterium]|nr:hypothetical protein [Gemmatimonadaceae bacterium]
MFLAVTSGVLTFVGLPWWVATAACSAALWFGFAAFRKKDLIAPTTLFIGLVAAVAGSLMARGAWEVRPFRAYEGEFIVVGGPVVVGSVAPQQDTEGSLKFNWEAGDSVTVECVTNDLKRPDKRWYRVRSEPKVFLSESQLIPSIAEPPGDPPNC